MRNRLVDYELANPGCWVGQDKFFVELSKFAVGYQDLNTLEIDFMIKVEKDAEGDSEGGFLIFD